MVRILAPVLVLLALLLTSGLCALGRYILQWRKKGEQRLMGWVADSRPAGDHAETSLRPAVLHHHLGEAMWLSVSAPPS